MRLSILQLRSGFGWTQTKLAEITAIDQQRLSDLERGKYNPNIRELGQLSKAFNCSVEEIELGLDRLPGRPSTDPWLRAHRVPPARMPEPEWNGQSRLKTLREQYGRYIRPLEGNIANYPSWKDFLRNSPSGSAIETLEHLREGGRGAHFCVTSPSEIGFDRLPVMEYPSYQTLGDRLMPAIVTPDWIWILQVPVITPKSYTLDGLLKVQKTFINLEIDGKGHNGDWDEKRTEAIGMPTLKLTEADVLSEVSLTDRLLDLGFLSRTKRRLKRAA